MLSFAAVSVALRGSAYSCALHWEARLELPTRKYWTQPASEALICSITFGIGLRRCAGCCRAPRLDCFAGLLLRSHLEVMTVSEHTERAVLGAAVAHSAKDFFLSFSLLEAS